MRNGEKREIDKNVLQGNKSEIVALNVQKEMGRNNV